MTRSLRRAGVLYRRQFAFAFTRSGIARCSIPKDAPYDCVAISNPILEKVFLPIDPSTTFVSYFGHLNGYDAGYYGYAWADAIAADMATVFEKAKERLSRQASRDAIASRNLRTGRFARRDDVDRKIPRPQTIGPAVLEKLGIGRRREKKAPAGPTKENP